METTHEQEGLLVGLFLEAAWEEAYFPDAQNASSTAYTQNAACTANAEKTTSAANAQDASNASYTQEASCAKKAPDTEETAYTRDACIGSKKPLLPAVSCFILYFNGRHCYAILSVSRCITS
jgi:hypothetical protein